LPAFGDRSAGATSRSAKFLDRDGITDDIHLFNAKLSTAPLPAGDASRRCEQDPLPPPALPLRPYGKVERSHRVDDQEFYQSNPPVNRLM
jgi:hypothetical protein